ncbi:MAG: cupin domain-containing protein [Candidatus Binatia bacterium]
MATSPLSQLIAVQEREWQEMQPGVRMKQLWVDEGTKRRALISKIEPGAKLPLHRHVGDEFVFVIEGANADEAGEVTTGNLSYRPNGCTHTVTTKNGATALTFLWGRSEMLE